mgnify:CR=1 FL=1
MPLGSKKGLKNPKGSLWRHTDLYHREWFDLLTSNILSNDPHVFEGKVIFFFSGTVDPKPSDMLHGPLNDHNRIKFLKDHLSEISDSIRLVHSILNKERDISIRVYML